MFHEPVARLIATYYPLSIRRRPAYLLRARLFLPGVALVAALPILAPALLWTAAAVMAEGVPERPLFFPVLFAAAMFLPVLNIFSYRWTLRRAPNLYTTKKNASGKEGMIVGVLAFLVLAVASLSLGIRHVPAVAALVTGLGLPLFFYLFRMNSTLREVVNFFRPVPAGRGEEMPEEAEAKVRREYRDCARQAPGVPRLERPYASNSTDIEFGPVTVGEELRSGGLAVGLPLLQGVTPEQFRACLLSECLTWSVPGGRLYHRYLRGYIAWHRLLERCGAGTGWPTAFYYRINPFITSRLSAHLFVLARTARNGADAEVIERGMRVPLEDALTNLTYKDRIFEHSIRADMYDRAENEPSARLEPFAALQRRMDERQDREEAKIVLNESMISGSNGLSLLPSPSERLIAMGAQPHVPEEEGESAAEYLFGDRLKEMVQAADRSWNRAFLAEHGELLSRRREARRELAGVVELASTCGPDEGKKRANYLWRAGRIREGLEGDDNGPDEALGFHLRAVSADPDFFPARLSAARLLLDQGDETGMAVLDPVLADCDREKEWMEAYTMMLAYLSERDDERTTDFIDENASTFGLLEERMRTERQRGMKERRQLMPDDHYVRHGLDSAALRRIVQVLERYEHVVVALLVRKSVRYFPEYPFYLLGLEIRTPRLRGLHDPANRVPYAQRIAEELGFLRGYVGVVLLSDVWKIWERMDGVPGSSIYRRSSSD